jgi:predicted nicotinamide N-methyase
MQDFQYNLMPYTLKTGISLHVPDPVEVRTKYERQAHAGKEVEFPYWSRIWPSAKAMADYILEEPSWIKDKMILELAAGIGLPSFTAAHLALSIVVSDATPDAVKLLGYNIRSNGLQHVSAEQIDWNNHPIPIPGINTLLLSDVCYDPTQYGQLLKLVESYKNQGTAILITAPERMSTAPFHNLLSPWLKKTFVRISGDTEIAFFVL